MSNYIVISIIALLLLVGIIVFFVNNRDKKEPTGEEIKEGKTDLRKSIILGIAVLILGSGMAVFIVMNKKSGGSVDDDSFVPFIPIWIAIFVPTLIAKNKKQTDPNKKKVLMVVTGLMILLVLGTFLLIFFNSEKKNISNFDECVEAGNPVMESYPRQCMAGDRTFTEYIGNELEKGDLIILDSPRPNQIIASPLSIKGQARGYWFFEGTFPVILTDWDGLIIAEGFATAKGDWMTEGFVSFEATIEFKKPDYGENGSLILQKNNPSGLSENDNALEIPVKF